MGIPTTLGTANTAVEIDLNPSASSFRQTSRQQATLPIGCAPITVAYRFRLPRKIKGVAHLGGSQQRQCLAMLFCQSSRQRRFVELPKLGLHQGTRCLATGQPRGIDTLRQAQFRQPKTRLGRIEPNEQRIVHLPQKTAMLAGSDRSIGNLVWKGDKAGHSNRSRTKPVNNRSISRKQLARITQSLIIRWRRHACQAVVTCRIMIFHRMVERADLAKSVDHFGQAWQTFANRNTHQARGHRPEFTTNSRWRVRFHVDCVVVAGTAPLMQENDRLHLARTHCRRR